MSQSSKISRSTIAVLFGIAATVGWLAFTVWDTRTTGHISSGQICLVHIGQAERPMPTVCVMAEARAPSERASGVTVILSREHVIELSRDIDRQAHSQPTDRTAFGTYVIHDSIHPARNERALAKEGVRAIIRHIIGIADSPARATEIEQLTEVLRRLG